MRVRSKRRPTVYAALGAVLLSLFCTSPAMAVTLVEGVIPLPSSGPDQTLSFGDHDAVAQPVIREVVFANLDDEPLTIGTPVVTGEAFSLTGETCSGAPLEQYGACSVDVRLSPAAASKRGILRDGQETGRLLLHIDGKPTVTTRLRARIMHPLTLSPMGFTRPALPMWLGAVRVGRTGAPKVVTLSASGSYPAAAGQVVIEGADADQFRIVANRCSGVVLAHPARCSYDVQFVPTSIGVKQAAAVIVGAGASSSRSLVPLQGKGRPSVQVTLDVLARRAGYRIGGSHLRRQLAKRKFSLGLHAWPVAGQVEATIELLRPDGLARRVLARGRPVQVTGAGREPIAVDVRPGARRALRFGRWRAELRLRLVESDGTESVGVRRVRVSGGRRPVAR